MLQGVFMRAKREMQNKRIGCTEVQYKIPSYQNIMDNYLKKSLKNILSVVNKKNKLNSNLKKIFDLLEKEDI